MNGQDVSRLDHEAGGHRIQRIPPTERRGRVHTSTVTVAVLNEHTTHVARRPEDFRVEWYSGSGAGGQHRNKHQNSCRITHIPTGLVRKAETRSRESSRRLAFEEIHAALDQIENANTHVQTNAHRREQVGSGMRGDKRRTYRFQEDVVVDHVTRKRARCTDVMRGDFEKLWG